MILKKLEIQGYGPFSFPTTLHIDDKVTILTGQNDVGKTSILRLIQLLCSNTPTVEEDQNIDRKHKSTSAWNLDPEVYCKATFKLDELYGNYLAASNARPNYEAEIGYRVTRGEKWLENIRNGNSIVGLDNNHIHRFPSVLSLPSQDEISSEFGFQNANSLEKQFLTFAFGINSEAKFSTSRPDFRTIVMRQANKRIQERLNEVLPVSLGLNLSIHPESIDPYTFSVHFEDIHNGLTTIRQRGTGIRKIVNLVVSLVSIANATDHFCILLDEPENSLHADSQHKLRGFLDTIGANPKVQVIYSTHSASMINSLTPHNVRLLKRATNEDGQATTRIDNHPYRENFLSVRTSLGISPSDSLLFGAVSIVIEGATESLCLPYIFRKLEESGTAGFDKALFFLSLSHFVSGGGTEYEHWCKFALEIGAKPILLLDGDKRRDLERRKFAQKYPKIPTILFPDKLEFENLVPVEQYVNALADELKNDNLTPENYKLWEQTAGLNENMMFTKRITKWLNEAFSIDEIDYNKPATMKRAVELTPAEEIRTEELLKLLNSISTEMDKL